MKLQFEPNQQYRLNVIQAVPDIFARQLKDEKCDLARNWAGTP